MMNRAQKESLVSDLKDMFEKSSAAFLVNYQGLTVSEMQDFRRRLQGVKGKLKVAKVRLTKIAAGDLLGSSELKNNLKEQVALVFAFDEPSLVAKNIVDFAKEHKPLRVVGGLYDSSYISEQEVVYFASLPSREVLLGQLAATLQAPIASFAGVLQALLSKLSVALKEVEKKK